MQITLLIPELIWPAADDGVLDAVVAPELATLLARSRRTRRPPQSLEATLADAFGQTEGAPYAAWRLLGETDARTNEGDGSWLCCDPVHLRYHHERLILADSGSFAITLDEAQALVAELNRELAGLGRFQVGAADRWYLQLIDRELAASCQALPLSAVAGRRIDQSLPQTAAARALRRLLNEAQMLLHAHPINQRREDEGQLPINGLWLWGGGTPGQRSESDFDGVWSGNPLARGLARAAGVPTHPQPADAAALLEHAAPGTSQLIVIDELHALAQYEMSDAYRAALGALERRWFAPLRSALAGGRIARLRIEAPTAWALLSWDSTRREQWALWRRTQPLAALARKLCQESAKEQ
jgi:hypothetical protein